MRLREPAPTAHLLVDDFEGDSTERLAGRVKAPAVADPDPDDVLLYIYALSLRRRLPKGATDENLLLTYNGSPRQTLFWVKAGKWHAARLETDRKRLLFRKGGCVRAERDRDGFQFYVRVYHLRKWVLLLPLLCVLLLCLSLSLCSPSGSGSPSFLDGQTSISNATSKPILTTSYASYSATPDTVWRARQKRQDMTLLLPATCTVNGKEGGNSVISSPSIAVDLNSDGEFSSSEILYNAPDETGYGEFLHPGSAVDHIDLAEPLALPAGTYSARTIWRSKLAEDGKTPAGAATFDWRLTVV